MVDASAFAWSDTGWSGPRLEGQVLYELHVGTFTPAGTWDGAMRELPRLAELGITTVELMPVADFPGRFGWGYDGVALFAPTRLYGNPDDFRRFVDRAHQLGLAVLLDVVYNHLGPDGNYLPQYAAAYFADRYVNEWGDPLNFDAEDAGPVREFFLANAAYWVDEYHLDGYRLDATSQIFDASQEHILAALGRRVREAANGRSTLIIAENEPQQVGLVRPITDGGYGLDALWNDDFHHSARVALTGLRSAYYTDYRGSPQELVAVAKRGLLYQGQWSGWQGQPRGTWAGGAPPAVFVNYLENHDQVANSLGGERLHRLAGPGRYRAMTAFLLLAPGTPMLFQGQEFGSSSPFLYFADHEPDLARAVRKGRRAFLRQFPGLATRHAQAALPDPDAPHSFERCKLDPAEREANAPMAALHRDLLRLRRREPAFRAQRPGGVDGAILGPESFVLRYLTGGRDDRLLVVNLGADLSISPLPEPLLAPPAGCAWTLLWSSEDVRYGGSGALGAGTAAAWRVPGHAALVLAPTETKGPAPSEPIVLPPPERDRRRGERRKRERRGRRWWPSE